MATVEASLKAERSRCQDLRVRLESQTREHQAALTNAEERFLLNQQELDKVRSGWGEIFKIRPLATGATGHCCECDCICFRLCLHSVGNGSFLFHVRGATRIRTRYNSNKCALFSVTLLVCHLCLPLPCGILFQVQQALEKAQFALEREIARRTRTEKKIRQLEGGGCVSPRSTSPRNWQSEAPSRKTQELDTKIVVQPSLRRTSSARLVLDCRA